MVSDLDYVLEIDRPKTLRTDEVVFKKYRENRDKTHGINRDAKEEAGLSPARRSPMSPRGKPAGGRRPSSARSSTQHIERRASRPADSATRRWRRDTRPKSVRAAVSATKDIRWTRPLIEAVLEELYVDDHFEELLGRAPGDLQPGQYAQAVAVALLLRHSWHPDDLACMLKRLKRRVGN